MGLLEWPRNYQVGLFSSFVSCDIDTHVPIAGDYTVVVSAFEPHHVGEFSLLLESTTNFEINPILQEGAGMYSKTVSGIWYVLSSRMSAQTAEPRFRDEATAVGGPSSRDYFSNPKFNLEITSPTQIMFVILSLFLDRHLTNSRTAYVFI
jgi:hypothetical protein